MPTTKEDIAEDLKNTMSNLPFPIAIVTAAYGKQKRGVTIGSFTSLSMIRRLFLSILIVTHKFAV